MPRRKVETWQGDYEEHYSGNGVTIMRLLNPRGEYPVGVDYGGRATGYNSAICGNIDSDALRNPGNRGCDWKVKKTDHTYERADEYVPMNSAARTTFGMGGHLTTANLSGCVALGAAYRNEDNGSVETLLPHYDPEGVRQMDGNRLRLAEMFGNFAGGHAVKVVLAYGANLEGAPELVRDNPEDYPIQALVEDFKGLAYGSHALLIPYNGREAGPKGNKLYVGQYGGAIDFGWNGHRLDVGPPDMGNEEEQLATMRVLDACMVEEIYDAHNGDYSTWE